MSTQGSEFDLEVNQWSDTLACNIPAKPMGTSVSTLKSRGFSFFGLLDFLTASLQIMALPAFLQFPNCYGGADGSLR